MVSAQAKNSVRVAVRIRPQLDRERTDQSSVCTRVKSKSLRTVTMEKDKKYTSFTYDYMFNMDSQQDAIYSSCTHNLIEGCFEGKNATVFAYGQTGSGKTYTMGIGFDVNFVEEDLGIMPRAVRHLYSGIEQRRQAARKQGLPVPEFKITTQFIELYIDEILDRFDSTRSRNLASRAITKTASSEAEMMQFLKLGSLSRTTASTHMNVQSSRSHAIFTIRLFQYRDCASGNQEGASDNRVSNRNAEIGKYETLTAKFHFVDLAGCEKPDSTGATGDRGKEGIYINTSLETTMQETIDALKAQETKMQETIDTQNARLTQQVTKMQENFDVLKAQLTQPLSDQAR